MSLLFACRVGRHKGSGRPGPGQLAEADADHGARARLLPQRQAERAAAVRGRVQPGARLVPGRQRRPLLCQGGGRERLLRGRHRQRLF